ncbi:polysaccharide deacetylase family protein [Arthrobacter sp. 2YAF22_2]|uniref:polysaccharide deacetylase family protein n=1 Tax=Arthrobacter sp. 2YAF22_2 TaxID=3233029 RepID=UPI003F911606
MTNNSGSKKAPKGAGLPRAGAPGRKFDVKAVWVVSSLLALVGLTVPALLAPKGQTSSPAPSEASAGPAVDTRPALTTVSFTFDSGRSSQMVAAATLKKAGMRGTFFVNSGFLQEPGYLGVDDLHTLVADGNEVGGHTVTLADLSVVTGDEAARQVCSDRSNLADLGFKVSSFAYPFGAVTPAAESQVASCGYNSARSSGDIRSPFGCANCDVAETVRPTDPFRTRSVVEIGNTWNLANLQQLVTAAEERGGWLQLVFYDIDESGSPRSITPQLFKEFTDWLAPRNEARSTAVRTVHEVIGGAVKPAVPGPSAPPAPPGVNALKNPGLEAPGKYGLPQCWQTASYGENGYVLSSLSPGHSGAIARRLDVSGYKSGDAKLLPTLDLGECSPSVVAGHAYAISAWYTSTGPTQFELYYRNKAGIWTYWTASPWFTPTPGYQEARWTTPAVPADAVGVSFGLNLFSNGELATDDYEMLDAGTP